MRNQIFIKIRFIFLVLTAALLLSPSYSSAQAISLQQALDLALKQNPGIQALEQKEEAADYKVWQVKSGHLPQLALSGSYTWYQEPNIVLPIHQMGVFPPLDDRIFESSALLSVPIFSGGKTLAAVEAAKADRAGVEAQRKDAHSNVMSGVAIIFLNAFELKDKEKQLQARLDVLYQRLKEMELLITEGRVSSADRALILSSIEATRADSLVIISSWRQTSWHLTQLLAFGQPVYPDLAGLNTLTFIPLPAEQLSMEQLYSSNKNILQARAQVEKAKAMESYSKRTFMPDLSGFAAYNYRSGGTEWDPTGEWAAGLRISIPVFNGGSRIAGWKYSQAALKSAQYNYQATVNAENTRLQIALSQWQLAQKQRQKLSRAVEHKIEFVNAQKAVYQVGRLPLSELMSQEAELLQLQLQEKSYLYAERRATIEYYAASGELTKETIFKILGVQNEE